VSRLFGTDGIRGIANEDPLTPELAFRAGRQLVATLNAEHGAERVRLVLGRDTRRSGPLLEAALTAGALSAGADCYAVGVLPTPGIALLTRTLQAHGGVVFTASHNPFQDNGIKFFSSTGTKFPDAWEAEIEEHLSGPDIAPRARREHVGRLIAYDRAETDYVDFLCRCFPLDLAGMTVALDCAHGATYRAAPRVFRRLGARVITMGTAPDGTNINDRVGALYPEALQAWATKRRATVGFAFDGDGDRLIAVDGTGAIRDGDYVLAIAGRHMAGQGRLGGNVVVTTVMANLGLEEALGAAGIRVVRTQVGDRYVSEEMQRSGANLGGEQSGHILFRDHAPTGDGIMSALALLSVVTETGQPLAALAECMRKFPQVLRNIPVASKPPLESLGDLPHRMLRLEQEMNGAGRILVRYSGTEPLARVMIEGPDGERIRLMAEELARLIQGAIGAP
jgi:phosphoglucosamine mutase